MTKAYRLVARIKNNRLWQAIIRRWPDVTTQSKAARRLGYSPTEIGRLLNMRVWPHAPHRKTGTKSKGDWWPIAESVASQLQETPDYFFDAEFYSVRPEPVLAFEFNRPALEAAGLLALPPAPDEVFDAQELQQNIDTALTMLTPREEKVLRLRLGLTDDGKEHALEEIAQDYGITREGIRQIERKALQKLRDPFRSKKLRDFV